ncbi:hypothetical protein Ocin01_09487 [Orchesella cincta]|uniref:Uncharacterized protein n=1 Tax=Orchesella cincta TaxID=48709 RepID=A0A1D2MW46_ORCCI|nr:hypothetical protein Ocin01_09487 [Orchesella cincta]
MLKRVFPDRSKNSNRTSNPAATTGTDSPSPTKGSYQRSDSSTTDTNIGTVTSSSANSSPLKSSVALASRLSSSSSSSPIKSEACGTGANASECLSGAASSTTNLSRLKVISRSCSSTEFQSLKLESMSTVEDFKSVSKTISSALDRDVMLAKQSSSTSSAGGHDAQESTSASTPSDDDVDSNSTESLFKQQAKFFCQMKDYLLSQQSSLRQHLELLNATVASRKKKITSRRQRFNNSGQSVHPPPKLKPEATPEIRGNNHDIDLMNEFHSCSSTEKSDDDIQVCPLCGVEIEDSENPDALEEHVASHWCSPDDPI